MILDVSGPLVIADYFVVGTARNVRHAQAIGRELDFTMKHRGRLRRNVAGLEGESSWVLLDFNEVVVHLFLEEARRLYDLESLWADVPRVPFESSAAPAGEPHAGRDKARPESRHRYLPSDPTADPGRPAGRPEDSEPPRSKDP